MFSVFSVPAGQSVDPMRTENSEAEKNPPTAVSAVNLIYLAEVVGIFATLRRLVIAHSPEAVLFHRVVLPE